MEAAPSSGSSASSEGCAVGNAAETKCNQEERMENWRSRLRAFYWAHDPRKVDRVDEILARHKRVHWEFGVRDFSGEEAIDDIYEHQRYSYLSFSWGSSYPEAVKDLEHVYTFAKDNRAERKKKWLIKKEKIKRQIHLLEKTIVSMQAVAKEEEESRQSERLKYQSSPHHSMRSILSPTSSSVPGNVSMDSPTNAINLASRMQCAQSKLDALRRFYWHPRENNYTLRFSIDGIFYGLRDFLVESFNSSFSIQISHQTNGAQGITPTCKVMMKGHTVCCGKHVKVVGEKGTRIPKSIWDSMYMDSDFEASICLIYVEDVADPGSMAQGSWEFLLSPEATRVELINFSRRVKGGMDLPEPMVRKLCSDVLTSLIRDLTLLYFPYELAVAFKLPPAKLDIKGELQITGQPIDDVMEKELQEIELGSIQEVKNKLRNPATASEKDSNELKTPLGPIMGAAANAAHKFSSLLSGSDKNMQAIANLLEISPAQFNLLVALKNCKLFPLTHNFHSLASICAYYNAFSIDEECIESKDPERAGHEEKLRATWKRILELIYIQRQQATGAKSTPSATPRTTHAESEEARTTPHVELFDVDKFFDAIRRLSKKPASVQVSVQHFYCTLNALNVVEALSKLYERVALGIDYRKPRSGTDEFIYGIRLGRKVLQQPAMAMAAAAVAASAAAVSAEDDVVYPVGSPPVLDLRRYRPAEVAFRTRVQTFSKFWQTLIKVVEFVRENVDDVSIELAGNLKGSGGDCVLNGSFKDAEFRGPLSMGIAVPPCFLGFYRAEMIPLGNDRVGMQVDVMLPSTPKAVGDDAMQQSTKALGSIGRVMIADLTSEVVIDLDALIAHEQRRRDGAKSGSATHEPPTQGRPQSIAMGSPKQHGAALLSPTSSRSPKQNSSSLSSAGSAKQNTAGVAAGVPKKSYQHRALTFSFGPTSRGAESDHVTTSGTYGQLNVSTSEFTKLHTTAKAGSFMFHLLSIVDWVFTTYVRPQMLRAFPEHQMLLDAAQVTLRQILRSTKLEMNFDVMARAFIHEDESLMVTLCGSPLHPMPIMYKDKVNLLDIIMQVDALANIWIDDRYPPYSNPLYF
ncbi:hypothetical protein PHYBOEH_004899 [Phytophthora boehmeriae]|uniref:Uncharacterized protein n=1 Tax=Phytophthora boehmeriae TaxID=109152 RepID=A0A8T1X313_9STRA|nr:hypothetical protein PHYBOEH_004899 [Phytophthora boehmeriae]